MKVWVEVNKYGTVQLHTSEPNPYGEYWGSTAFSCVTGEVRSFFMKQIERDTVAEFELNCIWERVKND